MSKRSEEAPGQVIAVIGMHRSGTSLVTKALQALGVALGDNLATAPAPDNAKGHWEDKDILQINREVLATLALQWELIGAANAVHLASPGLTPLAVRAQALLRAKAAGHPAWAFKDPRTARLWPFWRRVLVADGGLRTQFVWVVRPPRAVAQSLALRDGFDSLKSHLLWLNHNLSPMRDIAANPHVVVDYDRMLNQPRSELERIATALDLGPVEGQGVDAFLQEFLDPTLRHCTDAEEATPGIGVELVADRAYRALHAVACDASALSDADFRTEWHEVTEATATFADIAPRLDAASLVESSAAKLRVQIAAKLREEIGGTLQKQVAGTLRAQSEATGRRIEDARAQMQRQQREGQAAAADALQRQVADTLRAQSEATGRRIEDVQAYIHQIESDLANLMELLNQERYTVFKPLLRWTYRLAVGLAMRTPEPVQRQLRRLRRRILHRAPPVTLRPARSAAQVEPKAATLQSELGETSPGRHDVLVFPVIDWHFRFQRPQQLSRQLARRGHRVFYLSTTFGAAEAPGFQVLQSPEDNVFLIQLCLPGPQPVIYQDPLHGEQLERLLAAAETLLAQGSLANLVAIVDLPFWRPLAEALPGCLMVYDCMDHHAGFATNTPRMLEEEVRLLAVADLVVTTSAGLAQTIGREAENQLIRNGGEIAHFSKAPERLAYESNRPVAGYLGAIADWFDVDLIAAAAHRFRNWDFVLVGSTDFCDLSAVRKLKNVKLVGEVPYADAPSWVHGFDVALIPFKLNDLTAHTNPVKAYEYLAAGKPVVATALPETKLMDGMVQVAEDAEQFLDLLEEAMAERGDPAQAARRTEWASQHDWAVRAEQFENAMLGAFPKASVIVLTHNNLAFTQACLHGLEANTHYPNWELLLVDNGSTDGSADFLAEYATRNAQARLIRNDENLGFAAGNNRGLAAADGEYLVILNNDTYVTPGWLLDLIRHLRKTPDLGLVGPVTNNIGNEAKIDIHYTDMAEMRKAASAYTCKRAGELLDVAAVAFFCVALPRAVYQAVGGLDERFGLGFFEDDDYCNRVREAGFRTAVAEDVFVHHHLSASFEQMDQERRQALFERNKALYEEKWGPWTPHKHRQVTRPL